MKASLLSLCASWTLTVALAALLAPALVAAGSALSPHESARRSDLQALKKSVQSKQEANQVNAEGETLLIAGSEGGDLAVVRYLLDKGANIDAKDRNGQTALFRAVSAGHDEAAKLLIDRGASLHFRYGKNEETILFESTRLGHLNIIRALLKKRPELLKETNKDGETALFEAVRSAQAEVVELLVQSGANTQARDRAGRKPADLADPKTDQEILKALKTQKKA